VHICERSAWCMPLHTTERDRFVTGRSKIDDSCDDDDDEEDSGRTTGVDRAWPQRRDRDAMQCGLRRPRSAAPRDAACRRYRAQWNGNHVDPSSVLLRSAVFVLNDNRCSIDKATLSQARTEEHGPTNRQTRRPQCSMYSGHSGQVFCRLDNFSSICTRP